ncbi:MAG: AAA family ATPase [Paenibacillus sp.]|uniref:ATP-binding protein n=1 Tax=Paenibacillus sp. TaxID=58172 RepID=UPI0029009570|nr:AAA family ATPase [Paenibacillus sp.]MDU2242415.1 AAA family ATPase [Paenibacillus sp.]
MNKSFTITRIYIENFKAIELLDLEWMNNQLVVLDGPNGFGKTTIFDAIELVLTGKIDRIKKPEDARVTFNDVLFSNDSTKNLIIKLQLNYNNETITLAKVLPSNKRLTGVQKQPGRWEIFDTYLLDSFDSPLDLSNKITQAEVNEKFDINELERVYGLYYYIQQQENTSFLKKPGKERLAEISRLFDTKKEEDQKKYLQKILKYLAQEKKFFDNKIQESENRIREYQKLDPYEGKQEVKFERLFSEAVNKHWDREDLIISDKNMRDKIIEELLLIEDFINNFDEFEKAKFNKQILQYSKDQELLRATIQGSEFISKYTEMEQLRDKRRKAQTFINQLRNFQESLFEIDYISLKREFEPNLNIEKINEIVQSLKKRQGEISQLSKIANDLNNTRIKLIEQMSSFHDHFQNDLGKCPLCGFNWGEYESLMVEIKTQSDYFSSLHDEATTQQNTELTDMFNDYLKDSLSGIELFLSTHENQLDESFFQIVKLAKLRENEVKDFLKFCFENEIDISKFTYHEYNLVVGKDIIRTKIDDFSTFLMNCLKKVKDGYSEHGEKYQNFTLIYKELFSESRDAISNITIQKINNKKQYVDWVFYSNINSNLEKEKNILTRLNTNCEKLSHKVSEVSDIIKTYDSAIKQHWKNIMIDIEIPFYIYSGKVLQNYQRGLGLFIKEKSDNESIIFVSDINSDHDALNYLSSGQLSALVISFTLALNKIYGHKDLGVLLIDDPVQTMDEINIASLTELLRNDFFDKQIIISTHEEDVSRYLQYKFNKYGLNSLSYNMREETYHSK